eukprot:10776615-Alexandrium_andersonii.AAC.1
MLSMPNSDVYISRCTLIRCRTPLNAHSVCGKARRRHAAAWRLHAPPKGLRAIALMFARSLA